MDLFSGILAIALTILAGAAALWLAWWLFRVVFWILIAFIGEAGRAWRGDRS